MSTWPKIGTARRWLALALSLAFVYPVFAQEEDRKTDSVVVSSTLFRPNLEPSDKFYRDNFAGADEAIRLTYYDRWNFHETQNSFYRAQGGQAHLDIASMSRPGVGPSEIDARKEFASTAFKMRIDATIRAFLASDKGKGVRRAQQVVESLKAQTVRVSNEPTAAEIRMGYDLLSDSARLEYIKGTLGFGAYQTTFLNSFTNRRGKPFGQALSFQVWKEFKNGLPSPNLGYNVGGGYVQGGLSKYFNPAVRGELIGVKPVKANSQPDSVLLRMTYTF